ncbi:hypothetical protein R1sor_022831 [Riccia sorocarpa]|uniref:DDE Tnp4 domain-containing protein n=1 Tax=Riccia sorocarpa TaxID=122646 RepID=A0ABD3GKZ3_9MARC
MVNYTNRVMTALESTMGHEIAWPDRQERAVNSAHFAGLGFPGCIGLVDDTLVKLAQRPRDDGETYFDRKSNYSMNVEVICDQNKRVIYFFAGMPGSCHDLTCLRRSSLWGRLGSAQLFDNGQYLLGDSGYILLDRLVCSYKRTACDMDKVDFNTCVAHARVGNEHCIGILKACWHLLKEIRTQLRNPAENATTRPPTQIGSLSIEAYARIFKRSSFDEYWPLTGNVLLKGRSGSPGIVGQDRVAGAPLYFELYTEEDDVNYIRWKWISKKEAHRVLHGIDGRLLRRTDLHDVLWMDWARPKEGTTSVREFVLNWDDRTQSSTVGGREIPLTIDTMREYFLLPEGLNPPRSARHYDELRDWVLERSRTAKTLSAEKRRGRESLLGYAPGFWFGGSQKPLEVIGAFLYILKNKVGLADEDENLDWATYFKEKIREEIRPCKKQMQAYGKRKVRPTCIGIVVLHILMTCGIVDDEDIVLSDSDKLVEEITHPRPARAAPVQVLSSSNSPDRVQDPSSNSPEQASPTSPDRQHSPESSPGGGAPSTLSDHAKSNGSPTSPDRDEPADNEPLTRFGSPMVPYPASEDDEEEAIEGAIKGLTSLGATDLTTIAKGKRPVLHRSSSESEEIIFAMPDRVKRMVAAIEDKAGGPGSQQAEIAHSWSHEQCTAYQTAREQDKDGFLRCKSVHVLYDNGICTKDIIIIDDSVQKNLPNHPFKAVHPRPFDPFQTAKKDENYLQKVLQPFLDKFRGHRGDGISYVEANWQQAQAQDPIACLANYWAPMDEWDEDFLWSNCTAADRQKFMAELHGHRVHRVRQKAMQFVMADAEQPPHTQDGVGPSNSSQTAATEIGRPIVPAPLSATSLISDAEFLLAGCRDEDMELTRLNGAL